MDYRQIDTIHNKDGARIATIFITDYPDARVNRYLCTFSKDFSEELNKYYSFHGSTIYDCLDSMRSYLQGAKSQIEEMQQFIWDYEEHFDKATSLIDARTQEAYDKKE